MKIIEVLVRFYKELFYEKSGATFSKKTKEDEIGGVVFNELSYDWDSLNLQTRK